MTSNPFFAEEGRESVFTTTSQNLKFGVGALAELGADAGRLGMSRIALFIDDVVAATPPAQIVRDSLKSAGLDFEEYTEIRCEPDSAAFEAAARFAGKGNFDGFISLGGGSTIDTAKAANLFSCFPDDLLAYVNAPIGLGKAIPGPLKPHIACPTTSGTGSETTGITIVDLTAQGVKSGIASPFLKPALAIVDPTVTETLPGGVVAATGFDVLTHAVESYTARPFTRRPKPKTPNDRPPYQGATPFNDIGAMAAIRIAGRYLKRAVTDDEDFEARYQLMFAATLAGLAFGTAGVHIPHAMSYSVATLRHEYVAQGYQNRSPMVPHGIAVVVNAPAAFRFTAPFDAERHLQAAAAMGADIDDADKKLAGDILAQSFLDLMRQTGLPNGLSELGYTEADIPALARGAFAQQRPLVMAPCNVSENDLKEIYGNAMRYW